MTKLWADEPFRLTATPTDTDGLSKEVIAVATEMCLAHNIMIRNLNSIYLQCEQVTKPEDVKDFIRFCQVVLKGIHTHHEHEEQYFFPLVAEYTSKKDVMEANIIQHRAFKERLKNFEEYITSATPETYDGKKVKKAVDGFGQILAVHLSDEIQTLIGLEKYGGDKLAGPWESFNKKILEDVIKDKHNLLPCALGGNDRTFEGGKHNFPEFPFFVPYLVNYYYARRYRGSWRFCSCTMYGEPKPLEFAKDI